MPLHKRVNWEFLAVVRGKIAPFERKDDPCAPVSDTFWLFPPGVPHGWNGEPGKTCDLVVIHFSAVPQALERMAIQHGHLSVKLNRGEKAFLQRLAGKLNQHYWRPVLESEIHAERALMDLSLLILKDYKERRQPAETGGSLNKVAAAETWLREHLADNPAVADAALAVGLSVSQLNRLFTKVRKESPQGVLNRLKIDRAMELLGSSNAKLHSVASECGFSNASNLCRAFKTQKGSSPTMWRRETFIKYKTPRESAKGDHTQHGRRLKAFT